MKVLYFDCFAGAAGDMILGALIDAGVKLEDVRRALGSLAISPSTVWTERVIRTGIAATKFCVKGEHGPLDHAHDDSRGHDDPSRDHERDHGHHHQGHRHVHTEPHEEKHHHVHRTLDDINRLIDGSALSQPGKDRAKELFARLGEAEAAIHGTSLAQVHLHEVGALDSIIDIVGAVYALESLGVERVVVSPMNVGRGMVHSAHGVFPVPAPATVRLLGEAPILSRGPEAELLTPTGALLLTSYADQFGSLPPMRVTATGYGAGDRDFNDTPNVLRVLIGEGSGEPGHVHPVHDRVVVVECEIDDMNPQLFGPVMDQLDAAGALEVFFVPVQMKKSRPGTLVSVLVAPARRLAITDVLFRETTTIGVRYAEWQRECLDREVVAVATAYGDVRVKVARRNGVVMNAQPEFDDCALRAREHQVATKDVHAAAMSAWLGR